MASCTYYTLVEVFDRDDLKKAVENNNSAIEIKGALQQEIIDKILQYRESTKKLNKDAIGFFSAASIMSSIVNPIIGIGVASYSIVKGIKMFIGGAKYLTKKEGDTKWESVGVYNCFYHPTNEFILLNKSFSVKRDVLQGKEMYTFYDKKCSNCNCVIADYKEKRTSRDLPEFCPKCGKRIYYKLG